MSEQEIGDMMNEANNEVETVVSEAPAQSVPEVSDNSSFVNETDCVSIHSFVLAHTDIIRNWKKVDLALNGNAITDTKGILVGVDTDEVPLTFNCKNLMIPNTQVSGITDITVSVSGIVMKSPTSVIYVTKNNIFVFGKDADGHTTGSITYYKVKGGKIAFKDNVVEQVESTAERAKLTFKVGCGRIYALIENLNDINEIRTKVLEFLYNKVTDINYSIKIESMAYSLHF